MTDLSEEITMSDEPNAFDAWLDDYASRIPAHRDADYTANDMRAAWTHQQSEIDRLTRALTEATERIAEVERERDGLADAVE